MPTSGADQISRATLVSDIEVATGARENVTTS